MAAPQEQADGPQEGAADPGRSGAGEHLVADAAAVGAGPTGTGAALVVAAATAVVLLPGAFLVSLRGDLAGNLAAFLMLGVIPLGTAAVAARQARADGGGGWPESADDARR